MSNRPVISIRERKRGTTRFLIGSTPRTWSASSSSRILRAPRSAVIAVPATPATTTAVTNGAIEGAEEGEEVGRLEAGRAEAEGDGGDQHRKPAQLQGEDELGDELAAV